MLSTYRRRCGGGVSLDFPSVLDASLITLENFSTALFCATCIFKYFDFAERSNLQTVTNEFLMDWNAVFL